MTHRKDCGCYHCLVRKMAKQNGKLEEVDAFIQTQTIKQAFIDMVDGDSDAATRNIHFLDERNLERLRTALEKTQLVIDVLPTIKQDAA